MQKSIREATVKKLFFIMLLMAMPVFAQGPTSEYAPNSQEQLNISGPFTPFYAVDVDPGSYRLTVYSTVPASAPNYVYVCGICFWSATSGPASTNLAGPFVTGDFHFEKVMHVDPIQGNTKGLGTVQCVPRDFCGPAPTDYNLYFSLQKISE